MNNLEYTELLGNRFLDVFQSSGYELYHGVDVSSRIDPSVYFVGSTISVLKPFLFDEKEGLKKHVVIQKAIRTQSLKNMESGVATGSRYGSYFLAMGTLAPYSALGETTDIALGYVFSLSPDIEAIKIRIKSGDSDLLRACKESGYAKILDFEFDNMPDKYYRHHYGLDDYEIMGRNCNVAIQNPFGEWNDIANIIVIERNGVPFAVEFAIGMSTMIANLFGYPHTMLGNTIADVFPMQSVTDCWIGDCVSVISCLRGEGLTPNSSRMQGRLLKRYCKLLDRLCLEANLDADTLMNSYEVHVKGMNLPI